MTIKEIFEHRVGHKYQIWSGEKGKWIKHTDEGNINFAIIFGDPGGDSFIEEYDNEKDFNKGLQEIIVEGKTGCDFPTTVYLIIKNGNEYKPTIS